MSLKDKLKGLQVKSTTIAVEGDQFLIKGLGRIAKNELVSKCTRAGKLDNALLEGHLLAACVCDPATGQPVMPDPADWDVPSHICGPLISACIDVCGFDAQEAKALEKKSEATQG